MKSRSEVSLDEFNLLDKSEAVKIYTLSPVFDYVRSELLCEGTLFSFARLCARIATAGQKWVLQKTICDSRKCSTVISLN